MNPAERELQSKRQKEPRTAVNEELESPPLFPWDSVVGVVDSADAVDAAVCDLVDAGFPESGIHVLAGEAGERLIDRSGSKHGVLRRVARRLQSLGEESQHTSRHIDALRAGGFVVIVPTKDDDRIERVDQVLKNHGGHFINYYTRMTTRALAP